MPSYNVISGDSSVLAAKINSTQTSGLTVAAMNINGSLLGWANTAGVAEISEQSDSTLKREWFYFTGCSVDATTKIGTFSGVVRGVARDSSDVTSGGTGVAFSKGATVRFVTFHDLLNKKANIDRANTWTAAQTIGAAGSIIFTNTTSAGFINQGLTTAQRDALTGVSNGAQIYNSTLGQTQWYEGGAWVSNAVGGSVADASTTVAGKVEIATTAEHATAAATGGTGATLVVPNSSIVKTSSGEGDENKIAALDSNGRFALGFITSGTADGTKFLRDDRTLQTVTQEDKYGDGSDGALNVTSGTTTIDLGSSNLVTKQYTSINVSNGATLDFSNPASTGTVIIFRCTGNVTFAGTVNLTSLGATGNTSPGSVSSSSAEADGGAGTNAYNNLGQTRNGGAGVGHGISTSSESAASGGGGAASTYASGTASASATAGSASAAAGSAGTGITAGIVGATIGGIIIAPGAGGGSGGAACNKIVGTQPTATGGVGGRGAGSLIVVCKGNYSDASGVINAAGSDGVAGSKTNGTTEYSVAYGGGGGGAGGTYIALVKGTITSSGTRTVTGGTGSAGANAFAGGQSAASSYGGDGAAGFAAVLPILS